MPYAFKGKKLDKKYKLLGVWGVYLMINELAKHDGTSRRIVENEYTVKDYWIMYGITNRENKIQNDKS